MTENRSLSQKYKSAVCGFYRTGAERNGLSYTLNLGFILGWPADAHAPRTHAVAVGALGGAHAGDAWL